MSFVQPGASTPEREMMNDMVCHMTEGELAVVQNDQRFNVKKGDVWACAKGISTEGTRQCRQHRRGHAHHRSAGLRRSQA